MSEFTADHRKTVEELARFWETHAEEYPESPEKLPSRAAALRALLADRGEAREEIKDRDRLDKLSDHMSYRHEQNLIRDKKRLEAEVERLKAELREMARLHNALEDRRDAALASAKDSLHRIQFAPWQERETVDLVVGMIVKALEGKS